MIRATMPSHKHQSLTKLLTESPRLVPALVREVFGFDVPRDVEILPSPETVREVQYPEFAADGAVLVRKGDDSGRELFIVEVQLRPDPAKRMSWPLYVAGLRQRQGCPATLVVLTDDEQTATWCTEPIDLGRGQMVLRPLVLGPTEIPRDLDDARARQLPELAVLAVITHGHEASAGRLGRAALEATKELATRDRQRATLYADLILAFLSEGAIKALEDEMGVSTDAYISDFAKRYVSQGLEQGRVRGRAEALLVILESRGLTISEQVRARVMECADVEQLDAWLAQATTTETADALFEA